MLKYFCEVSYDYYIILIITSIIIITIITLINLTFITFLLIREEVIIRLSFLQKTRHSIQRTRSFVKFPFYKRSSIIFHNFSSIIVLLQVEPLVLKVVEAVAVAGLKNHHNILVNKPMTLVSIGVVCGSSPLWPPVLRLFLRCHYSLSPYQIDGRKLSSGFPTLAPTSPGFHRTVIVNKPIHNN